MLVTTTCCNVVHDVFYLIPSLGDRLCTILKQIETLGKYLKTASLAVDVGYR